MSIWTPSPGIDSERRRIAVEMESYQQGVLDEWNRELQRIDPDLQLIRAKPGAEAPGLRPGFYHLLRCEPGGVPGLVVLEDPQTGAFREPGSWMFDLLRSCDLWDDRVVRDREAKLARAQDALNRARAREVEDRQAEVLERWQAANRAQVSMSKDVPWTQSASAKRAA